MELISIVLDLFAFFQKMVSWMFLSHLSLELSTHETCVIDKFNSWNFVVVGLLLVLCTSKVLKIELAKH